MTFVNYATVGKVVQIAIATGVLGNNISSYYRFQTCDDSTLRMNIALTLVATIFLFTQFCGGCNSYNQDSLFIGIIDFVLLSLLVVGSFYQCFSVDQSICTINGNLNTTDSDLCDNIKNAKKCNDTTGCKFEGKDITGNCKESLISKWDWIAAVGTLGLLIIKGLEIGSLLTSPEKRKQQAELRKKAAKEELARLDKVKKERLAKKEAEVLEARVVAERAKLEGASAPGVAAAGAAAALAGDPVPLRRPPAPAAATPARRSSSRRREKKKKIDRWIEEEVEFIKNEGLSARLRRGAEGAMVIPSTAKAKAKAKARARVETAMKALKTARKARTAARKARTADRMARKAAEKANVLSNAVAHLAAQFRGDSTPASSRGDDEEQTPLIDARTNQKTAALKRARLLNQKTEALKRMRRTARARQVLNSAVKTPVYDVRKNLAPMFDRVVDPDNGREEKEEVVIETKTADNRTKAHREFWIQQNTGYLPGSYSLDSAEIVNVFPLPIVEDYSE